MAASGVAVTWAGTGAAEGVSLSWAQGALHCEGAGGAAEPAELAASEEVFISRIELDDNSVSDTAVDLRHHFLCLLLVHT